MNKYFSLPGYYHDFLLIKVLYEYRAEHPEYFIEDHIIESAYDLPSPLKWNGGRNFDSHFFRVDIEEAMNWYRNTNIELRHTCTNMLLKEEHLADNLCNMFFTLFVQPQDKIIIYSSLLKEYLHKNYPELKFIYSTTLDITDLTQINDLSQDSICVIDYNYNNDNDYLQQLQHPQNIELVCAEPCIPHCPERMRHYTTSSRINLILEYDESELPGCPFNPPYFRAPEYLNFVQSKEHAITLERIEELSALNINHFKISGRTLRPTAWIEVVCYYLVKPEYFTQVTTHLKMEHLKQEIKYKFKEQHI